jgi:hypothetical protein
VAGRPASHVTVLDVTWVTEKMLENKPEGRIKVRRSRLRWLEDVESDLGKVKRWQQKANNRK